MIECSKQPVLPGKQHNVTHKSSTTPQHHAFFSLLKPIKTNHMNKSNSIVAIYPSHTAAESAVKELQRSGFDMKKLSIVGRDYHTEEHVVGYYNAGDRIKAWGQSGAFWGGLWGLLFGSAFFWIPGLGPLFVAGPLVTWIVGALEGAVVIGGLSALGAGLYSLGIPKDSILLYETALKTDKFLLIAHGDVDELARAKEILKQTKAESLDHHVVSTPVLAGAC